MKQIQFINYKLIDDDYIVIAKSKESVYIDYLCDEMDEIKSYNVSYKVKGEFPDKRTLDSLVGENQYNDKYELVEEHEEEEEEKKGGNEKKGFPTYAIALIVVLGVLLLAGAAFLTYKLLAKKSVEVAAMAVSENPEIVKPYSEQQFQAVETSSPRIKKKRNIQNRSVNSMANPNNVN